MTIAEEIKKKMPTTTTEAVKNSIRNSIISFFTDYPNRVVGFRLFYHNIMETFAMINTSSPFPQLNVSLYVPDSIDREEINIWLKEEGLEWNCIEGEFAWRLALK